MIRRRPALILGMTGCLAVAVARAQQPPPVVIPTPPLLQNYQPVTPERLLKPEDENVLMIRRTYNGWGYSPLKQINASNAGRLQRGTGDQL